MNNYRLAIDRGRTTEFLLGRNEYFVPSRDYGDHDISSTYMDFLNFALEEGELNTFVRIDMDLQKALEQPDLTEKDIINILGYIHFYFRYRFTEKKFTQDWKISSDLKRAILQSKTKFQNQGNFHRIQNILSKNFNFKLE